MNTSKDATFFRGLFGTIGVIFALAVVGWILNVYQLITQSPTVSEWTAVWVIKAIGVALIPLGSVAGWIGLF